MVLEEDFATFGEAANDDYADLPQAVGRDRPSTSKRDGFNIKATLVIPPSYDDDGEELANS